MTIGTSQIGPLDWSHTRVATTFGPREPLNRPQSKFARCSRFVSNWLTGARSINAAARLRSLTRPGSCHGNPTTPKTRPPHPPFVSCRHDVRVFHPLRAYSVSRVILLVPIVPSQFLSNFLETLFFFIKFIYSIYEQNQQIIKNIFKH